MHVTVERRGRALCLPLCLCLFLTRRRRRCSGCRKKRGREGGRERERGSNKRSSKVSPKEKKSNPVHRNSRFVFFFQALAFRTHRQGFDVFHHEEPRAPEERRARRHGDQGLDRIIFRRGSDVGACQGRRLGSRGELDDGARVAVHEAGAGGHRFDEFGGTKTTRSPRKRERERRRELDMHEEREVEERELERKKLDRELRRKKKRSESTHNQTIFLEEREQSTSGARRGETPSLSLSLSLCYLALGVMQEYLEVRSAPWPRGALCQTARRRSCERAPTERRKKNAPDPKNQGLPRLSLFWSALPPRPLLSCAELRKKTPSPCPYRSETT